MLLSVSAFAVFVDNRKSSAGGGYPYDCPNASGIDKWGMFVCQCTSFVAWKLNAVSGYDISRDGKSWNAYNWKENAQSQKKRVDNTPTVGSVAWWNKAPQMPYGHVAYVSAVNGNSVTVEEYNSKGRGEYGTRTIDKSAPDGYIHFFDQNPGSSSGSGWKGVGGMISDKKDRLSEGQTLSPNHYITSADGSFVLAMQSDGNLVIYGNKGAIWSSGTDKYPGSYLGVQGDGNVVVYRSDNKSSVWAVNAGTAEAPSLVMQNDGNLVLYNSAGKPYWASDTVMRSDNRRYVGSDNLKQSMRLTANQYIRSTDWRYTAVMQSDGNFVVYAAGGRAIWSSGTDKYDGSYLGVQGDGNVVIYKSDNKTSVWAVNAGTASNPRFVMQADGNLVLYNGAGKPYWASDTNGKF